MKFETETLPEAIASLLPERVEEFNMMQTDRRCTMTPLPAEEGTICLRVRDGLTPAGTLEFRASVRSVGDRTEIEGAILPPKGAGRRTVGDLLYGWILSGLVRLTAMALLYGAVLGISFLCSGRSFLLPLVAPAGIAVLMAIRAVRVRRSLPLRVESFFRDYLGCTVCDGAGESTPESPAAQQ